jgi:hypothetical protein
MLKQTKHVHLEFKPPLAKFVFVVLFIVLEIIFDSFKDVVFDGVRADFDILPTVVLLVVIMMAR